MGNARDKKDRDVDFNGKRAYNPGAPTQGNDLVRLQDVTPGGGLLKATGANGTIQNAVVNVDYQKVLAFEGADVTTGVGVDTFVLKDTVANLTALAAIGTGTGAANVHNGSRVRVRTLRRDYVLDTANTLTADGINVVNASGGGRWIAQLSLDQHWLAQTVWYVDPANGAANDENTGATSGAPLKTLAELNRRLIGARLNATVVVNIMSDVPSADLLQLSFCPNAAVSPAAYLIFRGARTTVFSGTITSYSARNPATNASTTMTCSSLPSSWTSSGCVGLRAESFDGINYRTAWVLADLGSKTARLSIPSSTNVAASGLSSGAIADFTVGQTVNVYSVPTIGASAVLLACQSVLFQDLNITTFEAALGSSYVTMGVRFIGSGQVNLTSSGASYIATKFDTAVGGVNSQFFFGSGCVLGNPGTNHFNVCNITAQNGLTLYRLGASECVVTIITDLEHFFPAGASDNGSQFVFNFPDSNSAITVTGNVYGDALTNLVTFDARARNCSAMFGVMPTIGTYINSGVRSPVGATNSFRYFLASDLSISNYMDEFGNEVQVSYLGTGSGPAASARTVLQAINARIDTVPGLRHTILREQSSGVFAYAKGDAAANATGALAVVVGSQEITGASVYCLAGVAGRLLVQFDGTPTVGAMSYLSPTTDGNATTTFPAVSGTNQMRALGIVVAVSGTLGLIAWNPDPGPRPAYPTATSFYSFTLDFFGNPIPGAGGVPLTSAYQSVSINGGAALTQRSLLNLSSSFTGADNAGATRTDIALANVGPGAGTIGSALGFIQTLTINAFGQVVSATTGSAIQNIQANGVAQPQRGNLNFTTSFALTDNAGGNQSTVALATVGPGAGTIGSAGLAIQSLTLNTFGQVTAAVTVGVESPLTFNSGLTRTGNVVQNDVVTGITGTNQAWRGSVSSGGQLTIYASTVAPGSMRLIAGSYILNGLGSGLVKATGDTLGLATANVDYLVTAYQTLQSNGSALAQQKIANFSTSFVLANDGPNSRTNVSLATVGPGSGTIGGGGVFLTSLTLNTFGQVTAATTAAAYYQFVDDAGSATSQQSRLNVLRPLVATADALAFRTNLSLATTGPGAGVIGGAGLAIQSITLDVYGRVTAASTASYADASASYWTSKAESSLSAEVNLGALTSGILKIAVSGGVATPSTASAGVDFENPLTFSTGLTRTGNVVQNDVVTGIAATTPAWRGSTSAGGSLWIYASTVSPGPLRLVAGSYVLSGIGTGLLKAASDTVGLAVAGVDYATAITAANGSVLYMAGGAVTGDPSSFFYDSQQFGLLAHSYDFTQRALAYTGTQPRGINVKAGAHTNLPTAELVDVKLDLARTATFVAGNIGTMRAMLVTAPTYAFPSGSTITTAATLAISGAPNAGANATITESLALWVQAGVARFDGGARTFGITGTGALVALSISQTANNVSTGGTAKGIGASFTFAPTSGSAGFNAMDVGYAVNQTGGANGIVRGIFVNATPTSVLGTHRLLELQLNGSPKFYIDAASGNIATTIGSGLVKSVGGTLATAILGTDVEAFLAFTSPGLTRIANTIYNDVFTGVNLATVFWSGSSQIDGNLFLHANSTGDSGYLALEGGGKNLAAGIILQHDNQFKGAAGVQRAVQLQSTFAPTSGTANFRALSLEYTINQTGGASGFVEGISIRPTVTAGGANHLPINYMGLWRVTGSGSMNMSLGIATAFPGDIGMSSLGRPRFHHSSGGTQPVAATNDPLFVLKFSGDFCFQSGGTALTEQSFGDDGMNAHATTPRSQIALSSSSDTWASHASAFLRNEFVFDLQPLPMKTLKMRSLIVNVVGVYGSGSTGDMVWSIYKISSGGAGATITEVARVGTFFGVAIPWTSGGATFRIDAQNISAGTTWTDNDRVMLTCRNVSGFGPVGGGDNGVLFTAVARFDVAED